MGILNVTPDSFSDGGYFLRPSDALKHAENLIRDGADITMTLVVNHHVPDLHL